MTVEMWMGLGIIVAIVGFVLWQDCFKPAEQKATEMQECLVR